MKKLLQQSETLYGQLFCTLYTLGSRLIFSSYRPIVEEANKVGPAFSRIFKEMILITSPDKPLPRAGKGTVMRKAALALYNDEIDQM